jgi:pimeloyl-ACP methyl ester carboxylesterase
MYWLISTALAGSPVMDGPWEHRQIQAGELSMHVLVAGDAHAPPVLLLHGFPDSSHGWRGVLPALAQDHRVFAPDLRGYGGTQAPREGYDIERLAQDIIALLDALELPQVDLIGHDWGAAITWQLAAAYPDRFKTITALSVPHPTALYEAFQAVPAQRDYKKFANLMKNPLAPRFLAGISEQDRGEKVYFPELVDDSAMSSVDQAHYHALFDEVSETRPPLRYYKTNFGSWRQVWQEAQVFPEVTVPTLVLWGEQDTYMLASEAWRSCEYVTARCEVALNPDAGHWLQWEQADWVVQTWRAFVEP